MRLFLRVSGLLALAACLVLVVAQAAADSPTTLDTADTEAFLELGQQVYDANCLSCHGASGGGGVGVPLAGNDYLEDTSYVIEQIMYGGGFMPGFGHLSDEEIAAVASDVRTSWGNNYGLVSIEEVEARR